MVFSRSNSEIYYPYLRNYCLYFLSEYISRDPEFIKNRRHHRRNRIISRPLDRLRALLTGGGGGRLSRDSSTRPAGYCHPSTAVCSPPQIMPSPRARSRLSQRENPQRHTFHNNRIATWTER